jgi:hypothetical protein
MPNNNRLLAIWQGLARNNRWSELVSEEDVITYSRRLVSEGPEFYAREMKKFRTDILTGFGTGLFVKTSRLGAKRDSVLPRFLYGATSLIFADDGVLYSDINVDAVACVNQLTAVFTKIRGGHTPQSEKDVIERFVKNEATIASSRLDESLSVPYWHTVDLVSCKRGEKELAGLLDEASRLVRRVLAGSDPREISPKHGSGVSACGTKVRDRYRAPRFVEKIDKVWPMSEFYYASPTAFCDGLAEYLAQESYDPCAKVLLVPKDARGPRLISCEPRETMWPQQGLMASIMETVEEHDYTRRRVNFTRQEYNQLAAYAGSMTKTSWIGDKSTRIGSEFGVIPELEDNGIYASKDTTVETCGHHIHHSQNYSGCTCCLARVRQRQTVKYLEDRGLHPGLFSVGAGKLASLDLTDASDFLSLELVERLFPGNWVEALKACRSEKTELPDGRVVTLHKHAPMGSAVCFPVMALSIWAVLTALAPRSAKTAILVYGDDIIVPSFMAEDAMTVLEAVGLVPNRSKSFLKGPFRESCGEEFILGCRVTPVYLRVNPDDDNESLMSLMAFNNNMLQSPQLADNGWFLELLQDWFGRKRVPITTLPLRNRACWFRHAEHLGIGGKYGHVTLSGVAFTDDPSRESLPDGKGTRLHPQWKHREYRLCVPVPSFVKYETGDWCHVLRSLLSSRDTQLGLDTVHNRIVYKRKWVMV